LKKLRYHKVILYCDADVDGSHISTLILTFFFRFEERINWTRIYIATPLYTWLKGNKKGMHGMMYNVIKPSMKRMVVPFIQRYKGLGDECRAIVGTTMDPNTLEHCISNILIV
jgi:DNA gyrase subunit B